MSNAPSEYDAGPPTERVMVYRGRNSRYFNVARKAALCSAQSDYKHGAVLVKGGSVINTSCNKNRRVSFGSRFCKEHDGVATLHAELALFSDWNDPSQKVQPSMLRALARMVAFGFQSLVLCVRLR